MNMMRTSSPYVKNDLKGFIKLGIVLAFMALLFVIVLKIAVVPKDPITSEQAWNVMVEQGYEPQDITEQYYKKNDGAKSVLNKCIAFEKGDIHFEFYEFYSRNSAIDLYGQAYTKIILAKDKFNVIKTSKQIANYTIFTFDDLETYNVAIYVENTAVYAYSNSESKFEINKLLEAIDYLN